MKKYRNIFVLLAIVLIFTVLFGGCSSGFGSAKSDRTNLSAAESPYYDGGENYKFSLYDSDTASPDSNGIYDTLSADGSVGSAGSNLPADRKIIRDAKITMEVENVEQSFENILKLLGNFGGYESQRDMRDYMVSTTLKIPSDKLDGFLAELKGEGEIINSVISSSDISDKYFDAEIRLDTLERTLEKYYEFLTEADSIESQLSITREINSLTTEIEQLKGNLRRWDSLVDYSTVTVEIYKIYEAPEPVREINWDSLSLDDMGWYISSGFLSVCNTIFSIFQWIIIIIATISPVVLPIVLLIVLLVLHTRKKNRKNKQLKINNTAVNQVNVNDSTQNNGDNKSDNKQ